MLNSVLWYSHFVSQNKDYAFLIIYKGVAGELSFHWSRNWLVTYSAPIHSLNVYDWLSLTSLKCNWIKTKVHADGLMQVCCNSSALAMELLQSCAKPSIHISPRDQRVNWHIHWNEDIVVFRNFHHRWHQKLSKWQLLVQPVTKTSSKWRHFRFSVEAETK